MPTDYEAIAAENLKGWGPNFFRSKDDLFRNRYGDKTQFVYELLQNAEDAIGRRLRENRTKEIPRSVAFRLRRDRLEFSHCGSPFNERDVRAICEVGKSTKRDDPEAIGSFGIGFKSVYEYTNNPEVQSGDEHFRIREYVLPEAISLRSIPEQQTLFVLPFDKSSPAKAFSQIETRLQELDHFTLLFLRHINRIEWCIEGGREGSLSRQGQQSLRSPRKVTITAERGKHRSEDQSWLMFSKRLGRNSDHNRAEIAYRLQSDSESEAVIVPAQDSPLVVFFPTREETPLGFLIQGPYHTTSARSSIPADDPRNIDLIKKTGQLVAESLSAIRRMGLLTTSALQALPIRADDFPEDSMYRPIFDAVRRALRFSPLIPAYPQGYVSGHRAKLARPGELRPLLSPAQLKKLTRSKVSPAWVSDQITENSWETADLWQYLREEIGVEEITPEALAAKLSPGFARTQPDAWLVKLYDFLRYRPALWRERTRSQTSCPFRRAPIIRLQDGQHVPPFSSDGKPNAYLPEPDDAATPLLGAHDLPIVKMSLAARADVKAFFRDLPLTEPDYADVALRNILPKYADGKANENSARDHVLHVKIVLRAVRAESRLGDLLPKLWAIPFWRARNAGNSSKQYRKPRDVYLPTPQLQEYFANDENAWFLNERHDLLSDAAEKSGLLGILTAPKKVDGEIDGFDAYLGRLRRSRGAAAIRRAQALWDILRQQESDYFIDEREYREYGKLVREKVEAAFLRKLRTTKWLPGRDGKLHIPSELNAELLPEGFEHDETLIGRLDMRAIPVTQIATEQTGIAPEFLETARRHSDEINALLERLAALDERGNDPTDQSGEAVRPSDGESDVEQQTTNPVAEAAALEKSERIIAPPHRGRSEDWKPGEKKPKPRLDRMVSYVAPQDATEPEAEDPEKKRRREELERAAVERVLYWEKGQGRSPLEMNPGYPGYDIESVNAHGEIERYIEVKSCSHLWGTMGVALSSAQFKKAQELGPGFWLYVVQQCDGELPRIFRIQDPARRVGQFFFDSGWRNLCESAEPQSIKPSASSQTSGA